jgi:hypothetical protein
MKSFILAVCMLPVIASCYVQQSKTKVLLLGCFHFDNPGLDVAQFENANILSPVRQQEVAQILERLQQFKPDKIFVEVPVSRQAILDSNYMKYKTGNYQLGASEVHQLAFRLGATLNHPKLYAVDYTEANFPFDSLMHSAMEANQTKLLNTIKNTIDSIQQEFNGQLKTLTVSQILIGQNSEQTINKGVGFYFDLLTAGKDGNHVGSFLTSEWWRRNMIIYENILKRMTGKEEKILILFGSSHTALISEMIKYNKLLQIIPVADVLK